MSGGHLESKVSTVLCLACHLGNTCAPRHAGAPDAAVLGFLPGDVVNGLFAAHDGGSVHDCVNKVLVACAAADVVVLLEPVAHVFPGGREVFLQKLVGGNDEAGGAEAALHCAMVDPGLLQGMQVGGPANTFHCGDGGKIGHAAHLCDTGAGHLAVEDHGAGTAGALAAADFHACVVQLIAQHIHEKVVVVAKDAVFGAIDNESFGKHAFPPARKNPWDRHGGGPGLDTKGKGLGTLLEAVGAIFPQKALANPPATPRLPYKPNCREDVFKNYRQEYGMELSCVRKPPCPMRCTSRAERICPARSLGTTRSKMLTLLYITPPGSPRTGMVLPSLSR